MKPGESVASPRSINLRAAGNRQIASRIDNLVALHDNDAVLHERVRFAVEHPRRFEHD